MIRERFDLPIEYLDIDGIPALSVNGGGGRGIVHLHGSEASKETDLLLVLSFAKQGFWVVAPDAPDHGERLLPPRKPFLKTVESVLTSAARETAKMIGFLKNAGVGDIALSGRSLGGMRAIHAAAVHRFSRLSLLVTGGNIPLLFEKTANASVRTPETRAMFAGGYLKRALALEPIRKVERIGAIPVFLAGDLKDEIVPIECVRALKQAFGPRRDFHYIEYDEAGHALTPRMVGDVVAWHVDQR